MISIIIPVYNSEQYLPRLFQSILNQSNKDFEVVFIDDCSTDNSFELIQSFSSKCKNIRIFRNNVNRGASFSRNLGLRFIKGKIVCFVDSDDYIADNFVKRIIDNISSSDCLVFSRNVVRQNNLVEEIVPIVGTYSINEINADFRVFSSILSIHFITNKAFKKSIICNNDLKFDTSLVSGEDLDFVLRYLKCCSSIKYIDDKLYFYNRNNVNSITRMNLEKLPQIINYNNANILKYIDYNNEKIMTDFKNYNYDLYCYCINMINRNVEISKVKKEKLLRLNEELNYRKYFAQILMERKNG